MRRDARLIQLLDPPFDKSALDPGYISGYVPGVRENGGQYTHAAIWAAMAFAALGDARARVGAVRASSIRSTTRATPATSTIYKVEPYVVAADVYAVAPHAGRGGWTWYTGSAGWMYRLIIESLLGLRLEGDVLRLSPCIPVDWPGYSVRYRYRDTAYSIRVQQTPAMEGDRDLSLDGVVQEHFVIPLRDDRAHNLVEVRLPAMNETRFLPE